MSYVELVLDKLGLEHRRHGGRVWTEICPLPTHQKHNPDHRWANFFIRPDGLRAGQWHCFSCGGKGKLLDLVMLLKEMEFEVAISWLQELESQAPPAPFLRVRVDTKVKAFKLPMGVETEPLEKWVSGARNYVLGRGITAEQVDSWRVSYALAGRLAGRIVFPVFDHAGKLSNYTGRTFVNDPVRYLSASEKEGPDTSVFWGEDRWLPVDQRSSILLFEGAINGMAFERVARTRVLLGGLSGSSFDHRKAMRLKGFKRVIVATDPDKAGDEAYEDIKGALGRTKEVVRFKYPTSSDASDTDPSLLREAVDRCL